MSSDTESDGERVTPQGGILEGANPTVWDSKNPITLFVIQAALIVTLCRVLHWPLSKIRQPRVIAEVIGGIVLGPSVLGRIPGFTDAIFPTESIPVLNLTATLGLVLFLFLVGLETDLRFLVSNWRVSASVSGAGMILPFGLGTAISYGLYHEFRNDPGVEPVNFGTYLLFVGIAMAITAFPVLCRILTELKLLKTNVGVIVLSAGVGNDVVGWILLALCVTLVNAGNGIVAVWVLLACVGFLLFMAFVVKPVFLWYLRRTGSLEKGPSQSVVAVTILLALAASFFTQVIGVHAIFGGFVVGLICPHEGGFAIKLTEKIEDLVGALFLPLYFTLSGLQTDLGLLDSGLVWAYVVGVIAVAFFAKVIGGTLASRWSGLLWRESLSVGVLMSCKGLVELIVLNIGRQARILSERTFTVFVVMALVTTFLTTPLTSFLYPKSYQDKVAHWRREEIDWDGNPLPSPSSSEEDHARTSSDKLGTKPFEKIVVYLRLDGLSGTCLLVSLLGQLSGTKPPSPRVHHAKRDSAATVVAPGEEEQAGARDTVQRPTIQAHGVRFMELTDRLSSTMKVSQVEEYSGWDPVVNVFKTFGQLNNIATKGRVAVAPKHSYAESMVDSVQELSAEFLLLPWSASGSMSDRQSLWSTEDSSQVSDAPYPVFVSDILSRVRSDVGILVDRTLDVPGKERPVATRTISSRSLPTIQPEILFTTRNHHILFLYLGGPDDRLALRFVTQLARNELVTATIIHLDVPTLAEKNTLTAAKSLFNHSSSPGAGASKSILNDSAEPQFLPISAEDKTNDTSFFDTIQHSLPDELSPRVAFRRVSPSNSASTAVSLALATAQEEASQVKSDCNRLVVVGRRSLGGEPTSEDASGMADTRKALGPVGEVLVGRGVNAAVLVLQAGSRE